MHHTLYGDKLTFGRQRAEILQFCRDEHTRLKAVRRRHQSRQVTLEQELRAMRAFPGAILNRLSPGRQRRCLGLLDTLRAEARHADEVSRQARECRRKINRLNREIIGTSPRIIRSDDVRPLKLKPGRLQVLREEYRLFGEDLTRAYPVDVGQDYLRYCVGFEPLLDALTGCLNDYHQALHGMHQQLKQHVSCDGACDSLDALVENAQCFLGRRRAYNEGRRRLAAGLEEFVARYLLVWNTDRDRDRASVLLNQNLLSAVRDAMRSFGVELWVRHDDFSHEYACAGVLAARIPSRSAIGEKHLGCVIACDIIEYTVERECGFQAGSFYDRAMDAVCLDRSRFCPSSQTASRLLRDNGTLIDAYGYLPALELSGQLRRTELMRALAHAAFLQGHCNGLSIRTAMQIELCARLAGIIMSPLTKYEWAALDDLSSGSTVHVLAHEWLRRGFAAAMGPMQCFEETLDQGYVQMIAAAKTALHRLLEDGRFAEGRGPLRALQRLAG